MIDRRT